MGKDCFTSVCPNFDIYSGHAGSSMSTRGSSPTHHRTLTQLVAECRANMHPEWRGLNLNSLPALHLAAH